MTKLLRKRRALMGYVVNVRKGTVIESGSCTSTIDWFMYDNGLLEVIGSGDIPSYIYPLPPWNAYKEQITKIKISGGITGIGASDFIGCSSLVRVSLPYTLQTIGSNAFRGCTNLKLSNIPYGITSIGIGSFRGCTAITVLRFSSTPNSISTNSFADCTNITDIYVPWAENAVANAPWGAPSTAEIHYDSPIN